MHHASITRLRRGQVAARRRLSDWLFPSSDPIHSQVSTNKKGAFWGRGTRKEIIEHTVFQSQLYRVRVSDMRS